MPEPRRFRYKPDEEEPLSIAVVNAVAQAHQEDILDQEWRITDDINPDALDRLFQDGHLRMSLQFDADSTTITIDADEQGNPVISVESHR